MVVITEAPPEVKIDAIGDLLWLAANILERDGWCRENYTRMDGTHCIVGAVREASPNPPRTIREEQELWHRIRKAIIVLDPDTLLRHVGTIESWNDHRCPNQAMAIRVLRLAAEGEDV